MSRDPTKTTIIRARFRREADARIQRLATLLRVFIIDQDFLGNEPKTLMRFTGPHDTLTLFSDWFAKSADTVLAPTGAWITPHILSAYRHGKAGAAVELKLTGFSIAKRIESQIYEVMISNEFIGIVNAAVQQVARVVGDGIMTGTKPLPLYRVAVDVLRRVAGQRMHAAINQVVVKAHNHAKLNLFYMRGITHVGVLAEKLPPLHMHDADMHDAQPVRRGRRPRRIVNLEVVNVLTAGDDRVCETCEDISVNGPYEIDMARGVIPAHPNCRCTFTPAFDRRFASVS